MEKKDLWQKMIAPVFAAVVFAGSVKIAYAAADGASAAVGIDAVLKQSCQNEVIDNMNLYLAPGKEGEIINLAFFDQEDGFIYIRQEPDEESDWTGKLYSGNAAEVLEYLDGWSKIRSGNAYGYVPTESLLIGKAAHEYDMLCDKMKAYVTADVLNVRKKPGTKYAILTQILEGEQYTLSGNPQEGWYPIIVDKIHGWVCAEYIIVERDYRYAESKEEEEERLAREAAISKGQSIVDFACRFIGNPYVWGGTSLTNGADCSGFVQSVYKNFGIHLPRTTWDMKYAGRPVTLAEALPGDLVLYEGHVGLYMGGGKIVNAMSPERGITVVNVRYAPIKTIRRIL